MRTKPHPQLRLFGGQQPIVVIVRLERTVPSTARQRGHSRGKGLVDSLSALTAAVPVSERRHVTQEMQRRVRLAEIPAESPVAATPAKALAAIHRHHIRRQLTGEAAQRLYR